MEINKGLIKGAASSCLVECLCKNYPRINIYYWTHSKSAMTVQCKGTHIGGFFLIRCQIFLWFRFNIRGISSLIK